VSIQSEKDWQGLREAARITRLALDALESRVRPGVTTRELDDVAARVLADTGARSAPAVVYGVPGHALISVNDEVVHGLPGTRVIREGDLVSLDVTVEKDGYVADAARSLVVGAGSDLAHRLVACAQSAFDAALDIARVGTPVRHIGRAVSREVRRSGFTVIRGLAGHGVGRSIHEEPSVPNEPDPWQRDVLTDGLVLTIEPMISNGSPDVVQDADGWTLRTNDGSLAAHYEHTIVITRDGPVVLTAA
jgi:methionyl aminopeptidase